MLTMGNLDDLFPELYECQLLVPQNVSDGGHYYATNLTSLAPNKYVEVYIGDYDCQFYVQLNETVQLSPRPQSARIKKPRKWQLTRIVLATVAPIDDYNTIADAVNAVAAKLRENYWARYKATLDLPLEEIISTKLQNAGMQPPSEA